MTEFTAKFGPEGLLDVNHSASRITFGFSIILDIRGRITLIGPVIMGVADAWPDEDLQQRACDFARKAAEEHQRNVGS